MSSIRSALLYLAGGLASTALAAAPALVGDDHVEPGTEGAEGGDTEDGDGAEAAEEEWDVLVPFGEVDPVTISVTEGTWMSVDAHGGALVFDLLGDIWTLPLAGGKATRLTADAAWDSEPRWSPDGETLAFVSDRDGNEQIWLMDKGGGNLRQLTQEDEARVTDPVWDPAGEYLIVRRRTVDTRSIGVTELWQVHLEGGKGVKLTSLDSHPHAGETTVGERFLYFSSRNGRFNYGEDPVGGLWNIFRLDRWNGELRPVVHGPGSAVRPTLSPDGKTLAFVSRDRTKTILEVFDLTTGRRKVVADWLSHDQMEGFALHGVYPVIDWLDAEHLVLWAEGHLWKLGLDGERSQIPFEATGSWDFHRVPRGTPELGPEVVAKVVRMPAEHPDGRIAFSAFGALWMAEADGAVSRVSTGTGVDPAWSPDGKTLAWTSWTDPDAEGQGGGGALHLTKGKRTELPPITGMLQKPTWSPDGNSLVVLRGVGGGAVVHPGQQPWLELVRLDRAGRGEWVPTVLTTLSYRGANARAPNLSWHEGRLWFDRDKAVEGRVPSDTELVSVDASDGTDLRVHMVFDGAAEVLPSPDFRRVAFKQQHQVHLVALPPWPRELSAADGSLPSKELTEKVGDWLRWAPDGKTLTWMEGNEQKRLRVDSLVKPKKDEEVEEPTPTTRELRAVLPRAVPEGVLAITGVTAITMEGDQVIKDATIVMREGRIAWISEGGAVPKDATVIDGKGKYVIPGLIDVHAHLHYSAGDVLPEQEWRYQVALDFGVTTVHDPSASTDLVFTQAERVEAGLMRGPRVYSTGFVLYGALANEGAVTPDEEAARHHLERLKTVGAVSAKIYQQSRRDQRQWYAKGCAELEILCVAEGGGDLWMNLGMVQDGYQAIEHALPIAPLYADVRQWMAASRGAVEGSPGSAYTPTLLVAYGGLEGEKFFFQEHHPFRTDASDPTSVHARMLRHWPRRQLDARLWRTGSQVQDDDWNHQEVARDAAAMARDGVLVTLGAHGQLQGLGVHWELWALGGPGAMEPLVALQAGTIQGARYLGLGDQLGSIKAGKLADLVLLDANPLEDIHNSVRINSVIKNGEIVVQP